MYRRFWTAQKDGLSSRRQCHRQFFGGKFYRYVYSKLLFHLYTHQEIWQIQLALWRLYKLLLTDSIEDSEVENRLEKKISCWPRKGCQVSCKIFSFPQFRVGQNGSFKLAASVVVSFETNFFRIAGTSEAETSVSEKTECSLAIGEDKKSAFWSDILL